MGSATQNLSDFVILFSAQLHARWTFRAATKKRRRCEPLGTFCRIEIAARGFAGVSSVNCGVELTRLAPFWARELLQRGVCHASSPPLGSLDWR
jgi:hypothetical protein